MSSAQETSVLTALNFKLSGLGDCRIFSKSCTVRGSVLKQSYKKNINEKNETLLIYLSEAQKSLKQDWCNCGLWPLTPVKIPDIQ